MIISKLEGICSNLSFISNNNYTTIIGFELQYYRSYCKTCRGSSTNTDKIQKNQNNSILQNISIQNSTIFYRICVFFIALCDFRCFVLQCHKYRLVFSNIIHNMYTLSTHIKRMFLSYQSSFFCGGV